MRLRNKKTGGIWEIPKMRHPTMQEDDISFFVYGRDEGHLFSYKSLAELNKEWEDYKPKEPLIKDEKIRKAVRAWAEACGYDGACIVEYDKRANELSGIAHTTVIALGEIDFDLEDDKTYTIAELCGEEEE